MLVAAAYLMLAVSAPADTLLQASCISSAKQTAAVWSLPSVSSAISGALMEDYGLDSQKALDSFVPGLSVPDYGASMTSSIYLRGLGSRMENPVLGLYIDDIPILDKNAYDIDWNGISEAQLLQGPQGTLYGRNSMCGVLSLQSGPAQDARPSFSLEYGLANTLRAEASFGSNGHFVSGVFRRSDGWFRNEYTGRNCDPYAGGTVHWKWSKENGNGDLLANILRVSFSDEGGFAYGLYENGVQHPVNYNDASGYRRLSVVEGLKFRHAGEKVRLDAISSLQLLADRMLMDQDYSPKSIFTLEQRQRSAALTAELIARPAEDLGWWKPQTGFFSFVRCNLMNAPVTFKRDGIQTLILDNANRNIPEDIGYLAIYDNSFVVSSSFVLPSWNAALYHESVFELGAWKLTAGLRLDYEGGLMYYGCTSLLHYRFIPNMASPKPYQEEYKGNIGHSALQLLPKISALREFALPGAEGGLFWYGTLSKGYRAGGFNTQIFSDILQNRMMNGLMEDLGVYLDRPFVSVGVDNTRYMPEEAWNLETGLKLRAWKKLSVQLAAYGMLVRNQQLTVFPPGLSTGRMMTNAGRSRSIGVQAQADWRSGAFHAHASWAWNDARFVEFNDGNADYAGKFIPYSPEHTVFFGVDYRFDLPGSQLLLMLDTRGAGPFRWNESNTLSLPFSLSYDARICWTRGNLSVFVDGTNLDGGQDPVFYFRSMGHDFFALSKPLELSFGVAITI